MISRKIEERNEKIVRGLLKLPPNRRCMNCDSLGPQYVCTNLWTFICTTCSGIHREFTHRVKSISMSKFTTQEVEALQNGGNQRARELYLKGWDFQRQRLPDSSNVDRIREFIKNVYVDKKHITGKNFNAPSTDSQSPKSHEEHRRASSYHSYSQSPPYDHQYEERKYGKRAPVLTRKPGSERCLHEGKVSSFVYSPTHMSEQAKESRYANEGSISRHSLHSESSGGDPFRSENVSPSSYDNHGFNSPYAQASMEWKSSTDMEENAKDVNKAPYPQGTLSSGSSVPSYSYNSNSQVHHIPEHVNVVGLHNDMLAVPSMEKHSSDGRSGTLDLFADQVVLHSAASPTSDFFQLPTSSSFNLPQASTFGTALTTSPFQSSKTSPPSVDFFGDNSQDLLDDSNLEQTSFELSMAKNEGWATFDTLPLSSSQGVPLTNKPHKFDNVGEGNSFSVSPFIEKMQYEPLQSESMGQIQFHNAAAGPYLPVPSPWSDSMHHQAFSGATISQSWNAFEDPPGYTQWESIPQKVEQHFALSMPSPDTSQHVNLEVKEGLKGNATSGSMSENGLPFSSLYQHTSLELNPDQQSYTTKYTNPFDLPYDSDSDPNKEILNMNSLGAALPSDPVQSAFLDDFVEPWFSQHPVTTLPAPTVQGLGHYSVFPNIMSSEILSTCTISSPASLPYMVGQSQTSHFTDPLASVRGNPFA